MSKLAAITLMFLISSCASMDSRRDHYILKTCDNSACKPIDVLDSLSNCMEMRDQLIERYKAAAICQGIRE